MSALGHFKDGSPQCLAREHVRSSCQIIFLSSSYFLVIHVLSAPEEKSILLEANSGISLLLEREPMGVGTPESTLLPQSYILSPRVLFLRQSFTL